MLNMSIFKETVTGHSIKLKETNIDDEFNKAIITASFYSENAMNLVDKEVKLFREKASNGCNTALYHEGLKDIGSAIWKAIVNFGKAIIRIAINIKMMFLKGEKGLIKRLTKIKDKIKSTEGDVDIKLPVLKGKKGLDGFDDLINVIMDLASGNAYLGASLNTNGELTWNPNESDSAKLERVESLNSIISMSVLGDSYKATMSKRIKQDGSLVDVFITPARVYNSIVGGIGKTAVSTVMGNDADINLLEKYTSAVRSGVAKKGINTQLLKGIGVTDGKLKSAIAFEDMKGLSKRDVITSIDNIAKSISTTFATSTKGDVKKGIGTTLNFEDCMRTVIKDATASLKAVNKAPKTENNAEVLTKVQNIGKASATVMNVVLKDYMNMASGIKLTLHNIIKALEKDTTNFKPIKLPVGATDSFSLFAAMAGDANVQTK